MCIQCDNSNEFVQNGNKLVKVCTVCKFKELAKENEYKISAQDIKNKYKEEEKYTFFSNIPKDITYKVIEIGGKKYSVYVEKETLKRIYISHDDNKAYYNLDGIE